MVTHITDVPIKHEHNIDCIERDVCDLGDDGDGYVAYPVFQCIITGEERASFKEFFEGEDL